jgi:hypothetical protein
VRRMMGPESYEFKRERLRVERHNAVRHDHLGRSAEEEVELLLSVVLVVMLGRDIA